jgi:MFS family permease
LTASTRWAAVAAAFAAGLAIALNVGKVPVALPPLRAELGLSLVQAGWIASMLNTVAVLAGTFVGMWVGRLGAPRMVVGGLLVCAVGSIAPVLLAPGWGVLLATRFLEGLGFMSVAVAAPALISAASSAADRRFALGLWSAYMPAGAGLAMALSPAVLPTLGWQGLWTLAAAGLLLAATAVAIEFRPPARPAGARAAAGAAAAAVAPGPAAGFWEPVRAAVSQPLPWLLALAFGVWAIQHFALIVWMPTYLREQRGAGAGVTALLTSVMLLACVPGNLLGGALVQRGLSRGRLIAAAHVMTGIGALAYTTSALPDSLRFAAAVFVSFAGGVIPAAVMASTTVLARSPQQIGTLQGLYLQGAQLGQFVGTPLIAAVVSASGQWRSSLWVTGSSAAMGVLLGIAARRAEPLAAGTRA